MTNPTSTPETTSTHGRLSAPSSWMNCALVSGLTMLYADIARKDWQNINSAAVASSRRTSTIGASRRWMTDVEEAGGVVGKMMAYPGRRPGAPAP